MAIVDKSLTFGMGNFFICAQDETDVTYNFYGYLDKKGANLFLRTNKTATSLKYWVGTGDFDTNWSARAAKTYVYPSSLVDPTV
jgi:histidyl-tRNA synthetase